MSNAFSQCADQSRLEHGVYNLSRLRETATNRFKSFQIPVDWMLDTGFVSQVNYLLLRYFSFADFCYNEGMRAVRSKTVIWLICIINASQGQVFPVDPKTPVNKDHGSNL